MNCYHFGIQRKKALKTKAFSYRRMSSIPVDRTTKIGCPLGHPIFVLS